VSYSENFSDAQLKRLRWIGVAIFYLTSWVARPIRPFKIIWHVFTGRHETRSEMALANILKRFKMGAGA